jgi:hypothetical protein
MDDETDTMDDETDTNTLQALHNIFNELRDIKSELKCKLDEIYFTLNPLSRPEIEHTNLAEDSEDAFSKEKNGVYTWFKYSDTKPPVLIGCCHCALRYRAFLNDYSSGQYIQFVCLPECILNMGVISVSLLNVAGCTNPLPSELDICVIEVKNVPRMSCGPKFESAPSGNGMGKCSIVVGKSIGSFVSSHGGAVSVQANNDGIGIVRFFLDVGEPGDSGTLLYVAIQMYQKLVPVAIFSGLASVPGLGHKHGRAAIIPPEHMLQKLNVVDASRLISCPCQVIVSGRFGELSCDLNVDIPSTNNIVRLYDSQRRCICGVFVNTQQPINYVGDLDIPNGQ